MKIIFLSLVIFYSNIFAKEFPQIFGCFCEGGLISGRLIDKNQIVKIDSKKITVTADGDFIFAFGRKYKDSVIVSINNVKKKFNVRDKKYKKEIISGLPKRKVEPNKVDLEKIKKDSIKIKKSKKIDDPKRLFNKQFVKPVDGRISGVYGSQRILNSKPRSTHKGIDIAAPIGTKILSPSSGRITLVDDMFFTGKTIILDHGMGLISIFAHLENINVNVGDFVNTGQVIGSVGMTGRATGPHLHWGVYLEEISVDPMVLLEFSLYN